MNATRSCRRYHNSQDAYSRLKLYTALQLEDLDSTFETNFLSSSSNKGQAWPLSTNHLVVEVRW